MTNEDIRRDQAIRDLGLAVLELAAVTARQLDRIQALETQVAFQANAIETALRLSIAQDGHITLLKAKVRALIESHGL